MTITRQEVADILDCDIDEAPEAGNRFAHNGICYVIEDGDND